MVFQCDAFGTVQKLVLITVTNISSPVYFFEYSRGYYMNKYKILNQLISIILHKSASKAALHAAAVPLCASC